jgi:hypothetical protein
MNTLKLTLRADDRALEIDFPVGRVVNAGYVGRDQDAVRAHIEELRREGIAPPPSVPMLYSVTADNVTTAERIEVLGNDTSGEVEFVLLLAGQDIFVGVGSDHTDRALERHDVPRAKQICKNVLSRRVWRNRDLQTRWDELVLQSWVAPKAADAEVLYQRAPLRSILPPEELLALVKSRLGNVSDGLVLYSGTVPIVTGAVIYGESFRAELTDPCSGNKLSCRYRVDKLPD